LPTTVGRERAAPAGPSPTAVPTITTSTFTGNNVPFGTGGAIENHGTLSVGESTFSGNSAWHGNGGAIDNWESGTATVTSSTFSGNTAVNGDGGAIDNGDDSVGTLTGLDIHRRLCDRRSRDR
jgi:predicted outer membrane repeat protein